MPSGDSTLPPVIASGEPSVSRPARPSAVLVRVASRLARGNRLNEPRYKLLWQTVAVAASMLMFAWLRPPTNQVTAGDTMQSIAFGSSAVALPRTVSAGTRSQQSQVSNAGRAELRRSDYFVAKDFTNRVNAPAGSAATMQKSELTRTGQGGVSNKRVVVN
jgi:hypothetical protein